MSFEQPSTSRVPGAVLLSNRNQSPYLSVNELRRAPDAFETPVAPKTPQFEAQLVGGTSIGGGGKKAASTACQRNSLANFRRTLPEFRAPAILFVCIPMTGACCFTPVTEKEG